MSDNHIYLLRHAETQVSKKKAISQWQLTKKAIKKTRKLIEKNSFPVFDVILSSAEHKAYQTAKIFCKNKTQQILQFKDFNELDRDSKSIISKEEYIDNVRESLANPEKSIDNWEPASNALERFEKVFAEINDFYSEKIILIVSHGIVINLFLAKLLNKMDIVFQRWKENSFLDYAIIYNNTVIKDI